MPSFLVALWVSRHLGAKLRIRAIMLKKKSVFSSRKYTVHFIQVIHKNTKCNLFINLWSPNVCGACVTYSEVRDYVGAALEVAEGC